MNNHRVYLPIRVKNAEKDQDRIFPEINNIDLQSVQKMVNKPVIVFDLDQKILIQVSPDDIFKVGIDTDWEIISTLLHDLDLSIPGQIQNGDMVITAIGKAQRQLNEAFSNIANLFSTKTTSDLAEGSNQYFTQARARSAAVQNSINPSETQRAASQRAVHLALEALRTSLEELISLESTARISDVQDLINQINALIDSLSTEIQNRENADQFLSDSIQAETQNRIDAIQDEAQQRISSIENLISLLNDLENQIITDFKTINDESILGSGNIELSKDSLGLSDVDNTSDLDKPISNATQSELDRIEGIAITHPSLDNFENFSATIQQTTSPAWSNLIGGDITPPAGIYRCKGIGEFYLRTSLGEQWGEFGLAIDNGIPSENNIGEAFLARQGNGSVSSTVMSFCEGTFTLNGSQTIRLRYRSRNRNEIQVWRRNIRILRIG